MKEKKPISPLHSKAPAFWRGFCALALLSAGLAASARAQMITPDDAQDKARFEAVSKAVDRSGYKTPVVVGSGRDAESRLFALLTTHSGKGVLVAATEPDARGLTVLVELENDKQPADIGVNGIRFEPFLGEKDLVDVIVNHHPFMLEMSHIFDRHHILRRSGGRLAVVGEFDGNSKWDTAKGYRSIIEENIVVIEKAAGTGPLQFDVKIAHVRTEREGPTAAPVTERKENVVRYALSASGLFSPIKK
jgi:hypothetical protein